jgi:hypothetical protein
MHRFIESLTEETAQAICGELFPHLKKDPIDLDMAKYFLDELLQERRIKIAELRAIAAKLTHGAGAC